MLLSVVERSVSPYEQQLMLAFSLQSLLLGSYLAHLILLPSSSWRDFSLSESPLLSLPFPSFFSSVPHVFFSLLSVFLSLFQQLLTAVSVLLDTVSQYSR